MNLLKKIWILVCKRFIWAAYVSGLRQAHAGFMAWLYDRDYKDAPVKRYPSLSALAFTISKVSRSFYRADGPERLWDSISYPGRFQTFLDNGTVGSETANDCDDFAIYIAHALRMSDFPEARKPRLLLIFWMQKNLLPNGHAVCLFESPEGKYAYMDYGSPTYADSVEEIARIVTERYGGTDLLVWAELDPNTLHADRVERK